MKDTKDVLGSLSWQNQIVILPSGIQVREIQASQQDFEKLLAELGKRRDHCLALVNVKAAKLAVKSEWDLGESLISPEVLEQLPPDLLENDSLHLVDWSAAARGRWSDVVEPLLNSNALTLVFTDWEREAFIEHRKMFWGWLLKPSNLDLQAKHGSKQLLEQIVSSGTDFLIWSGRDKCFLLFSAPQAT